jgi:hypothetical protein
MIRKTNLGETYIIPLKNSTAVIGGAPHTGVFLGKQYKNVMPALS